MPVNTPESAGMNGARLKRIDACMRSYVDRGTYAGVSTLIARGGRTVHAGLYGWQDKEAETLMAADTIFRLYSMTKPIVCTALMTFLEEGRIRLVDPVAAYLPAFGRIKVLGDDGVLVDPVRPIFVADLMAHTSGLTYHFLENSPVSRMCATAKLLSSKPSLAEAIDELAQFPLAFQPGSRWHYSVGIDVAARILEIVSGRPLATVLRERLFEPLGMVDTAFEVAAAKRPRLAAMYGRPDVMASGTTSGLAFKAWQEGVNERLDVSGTYPVDASETFMRGGHGLFGTIGDYLRFAQMLANGGELEGARVIGRKTLALMHMSRVPPALLPLEIGGLPLLGYGFGLGSRVLMDVAQSSAPGSVGEFGWSGAAKTHYWVDPQERMVGLFMTQSMLSFDLPELDLRALAYQAIDD